MEIIKKLDVPSKIAERFRTSTKRSSPNKKIYDKMKELEVGEALSISDSEWVGYTPPATAVYGISRLRGRGKNYPAHTYALSDLGRGFIGKRFSVKRFNDGFFVE